MVRGVEVVFFSYIYSNEIPSDYIGLLYLVQNETEQKKSNLLARDKVTQTDSKSVQ